MTVAAVPTTLAGAAPEAEGAAAARDVRSHDLFGALLALLNALPASASAQTAPETLPELEASVPPEGEPEAEVAEAVPPVWLAVSAALPALAPSLPAQPAAATLLSAEPGQAAATARAATALARAEASATDARTADLALAAAPLAETQEATAPDSASATATPAPVPLASPIPPESGAKRLDAALRERSANSSAEPVQTADVAAQRAASVVQVAAPRVVTGLEVAREPAPVESALRAGASGEGAEAASRAAFSELQPEPAAPASAREAAETSRPVAANALWLAEQGGGRARLALRPPELGSVEIVVRVRGRRVDVQLRVEEAAAATAVRATREQLAEALSARNLRMEDFSIDAGSGFAAGGDSRGARHDDGARQQPAFASPAPPGALPDLRPARASAPAAASNLATRGAVDLRV